MLRVRTFVAPSGIAGLGLFAAEFVPKNTLVWTFDPGFDHIVDLRYFPPIPEVIREYVEHYGFKSTLENPIFILCGDDARFMNHSSNCNLVDSDWVTVASKDISPSDEITCDYGTFDERYTRSGFVARMK